jgi:hypothetical protein
MSTLINITFFSPKYTTIVCFHPSIHLGEYSIASLCVEIIICNCAFFEDHQSIFHALPALVVEMTFVMQVFLLFLEFVYPTLDFDMGFL